MRANPTRHSLPWLALLALALALAAPWCFEDQGYGIRVLTLVLLFAAMAQAWNIVGGLANQISLGHAAFFGLGAYTSTLLLMRLGISPWLGMVAAMAVAAVAGALLSLPTMRLRGHYFALATLAFGEVMRAIANTWASLTGGPVGISVPYSDGSFVLMQFKSSIPYYYLMLGAVVVATLVFAAISRSRLGYRLRAVKANPQAAEVIGVDTVRTRILAAVISAALMGACGTLYAQFIFFFDPDTVFSLAGISVRVALICIVGGIGTVAGPLVGALLIIPLEELFNDWLSGQSAGVSQLAYGLILVAIILLEPRGLMALWQRVRQPGGGRHA
ncbi:branched-chain amino acid ABC transporter permease [Bordetella genomosp. 2]|uniref:Branched-chain amino acid ABC transporter permease n=1 Tax=Bordetella genomosp. 2 TaxID=1983456 RepID=A0A261VI23_9BORD|nr:branched-chain amino acid ABC transporter permease [Bordetella genomosp. 2]OZI73818.1 branched-chain amino acid ABC transporter permease [Bordetella genomosp. 2]